jgi:predicted MPP superfamily phosphohydrolase
VKISRGNASIFVAGVENWGHAPFPRRGDLHKALHDVPFNAFVVLLSHDPSHWQSVVVHTEQVVDLTLSGHTHGMQFGIDLPWFRWSPVQWKYPLWGGLYRFNNRKLYVNIGFGFIGLPGRVGMLPEITVISLNKKKQ